MSSRDKSHQLVKQALIQEDWIVTDDPLFIKVGGTDLYIDLGAEKLLLAEKNAHQIAVEIKEFASPSQLSDFHTALGQYLNYRLALDQTQPQRGLFLAVSKQVYATFFDITFIRASLKHYSIALLVFDPANKEALKWIN